MWSTYFEKTKDNPPSTYLVRAVGSLTLPGNAALDLGSGAGKDTRFLTTNNFKVTSIDAVASAREYVKDLEPTQKVHFIHSTFEDFNFQKYDLINSSYSLPFIRQQNFQSVWEKIIHSLNPAGILICDLFGIQDSWNNQDGTMNFHTKAEVEKLLNGLKIHVLEEANGEGGTASGDRKNWHVFHIIAQKKQPLTSK